MKKLIAIVLVVAIFLLAQQPVSQGPQATNFANWAINLAALNAVALASPTAWGTAPSGNVIGVNANVLATVSPSPQTGAGFATTSFDLASTAGTNIKATAGNVYGFYIFNPNPTVCYLQFYNSVAPTLGTNALHPYGIQAGYTTAIPIGQFALFNFATAISTGETTTATGSTQCTAAMTATILYQ